jgi:hypothetical protein
MPVPQSYTEQGLADFMAKEVAEVGLTLALSSTDGAYTESVYETLRALGVTDIADVTTTADVTSMLAIARVAAWQRALTAAAARYDMSDGTQNLKRSQIYSHIEKKLAQAQTDAAPYLTELGVGAAVATVTRLVYVRDPYDTALSDAQLAL